MGVFFLLHGAPTVVGRVEHLVRQLVQHLLLGRALRGIACHSYAGARPGRVIEHTGRTSLPSAPTSARTRAQDFCRFAPYLDRDFLRPSTPIESRVPRTT